MEAGGGLWHGMTIKDILEKVDLFNITTDEGNEITDKQNKEDELATFGGGIFDTNEDRKTIIQVSDPTSAYLGPKLWDKPISLHDLLDDQEEDEPSEVISMNEFLAENNLHFDSEPQSENTTTQLQHTVWSDTPVSPPTVTFDIKPLIRPSIIVNPKKEPGKIPLVLPRGDNSFLYTESKRARIEREKEERRKKLEDEMEFPPEDLALATVPGMDFNPKNRPFKIEELRPQPIIRKRTKTTVPEDKKDEKYWEKRMKNKVATRRSREARRLKENQIALRAAYLEKENKVMKRELEDSQFKKTKLETEIELLKQKLAQYEGHTQLF